MAYDSTNQRLYTDTLADPPIGISTEEVRGVLVEAAGADLCRSSLIKPFAKKKPLGTGDMSGYTEAQAKAINYGLYVPYFTTLYGAIYAVLNNYYGGAANYVAGKTPWTNNGLASGDWARILDFDGYRHNASLFAAAVTSGQAGQRLDFFHNPEFSEALTYDSELIWASDIFNGHTPYMAIAVADSGGNMAVGEAHSTTPSASPSFSDAIQVSRAGAASQEGEFPKDVIACLILCDKYFSAGVDIDSVGSGWFIPVVPTRSSIRFIIEEMTTGFEWDTVMPWNQDIGDVTFTWYGKPNGSYTMPSLILEAFSGQNLVTWVGCEWTGVVLPYLGDTDEHDIPFQWSLKFTAYIHKDTKMCDLTVTATKVTGGVYVDDPSIYQETYSEEAASGGTIWNGADFFPGVNAMIGGEFGSAVTGYKQMDGIPARQNI